MNSHDTWIFYQIIVGTGTALIALSGAIGAVALCRIAEMLEHIRNHMSNK